MDIKTLVLSSIMLASGGMIAYLLRDIPMKIWIWLSRKLIYSVTIYQQDELFDIFEEWLFANYKNAYRDVEATLWFDEKNQIPNQRPAKELKYRQEESFFIIRKDGKRIVITKTKEKLDKAISLREIFYRRYVIKGWRAKETINELLKHIVFEHNKKIKGGLVKVYANDSWGEWTCLHDISVKPFERVVMGSNDKNKLLADLDDFVLSKEWYKERGIRYKRGYLLYGAPGNGKTTIAAAIAEKTGRDIFILNLNALENDGSLIRAFTRLGNNIVLLLEDIDRAFVKRENVDSKISFSSLLNSFDGVLCREGIITVLTTNHIDKLDEALIREGRMDMRFEVNNPTPKEIKEYIEYFYGIKLSIDLPINQNSMSQIQELCIQHKDNSLAVINKLVNSEQKEATG